MHRLSISVLIGNGYTATVFEHNCLLSVTLRYDALHVSMFCVY